MHEAMIKLRGNTMMNMIGVSAISIHEELVLLLFVCHQDLDRVPIVIRWRISVCDPDMGCHVASVLPSPLARTCKSGPEWISDSSETMAGVTFPCHIVVTEED